MRRSKAELVRITIAVLLCVFTAGLAVNRYWVNRQVDHDIARLEGIVSSLIQSEKAYADLKVIRSSHPRAWIFGTVETSSQKEFVRARVAEVFTSEEADRIVGGVRLASTTRPDDE